MGWDEMRWAKLGCVEMGIMGMGMLAAGCWLLVAGKTVNALVSSVFFLSIFSAGNGGEGGGAFGEWRSSVVVGVVSIYIHIITDG